MNYHLLIGGSQISGISGEEIVQMLRSGKISGEEFCWTEGMAEWQPLRQVIPSLFPPPPPISAGTVSPAEGTFGQAPLSFAQNRKSKTQARILAFWLGGFGAHKFYHGSWGWGVLYILSLFLIFFCFPLSLLLGLLDAIALHSMSEGDYNLKYNIKPPHAFKW